MDHLKHRDDINENLSDAASSIAEARTLNDEPPPSYNNVSAPVNERPPEKPTSPLQIQEVPEVPQQVPTATNPFAFPIQEPPSYLAVDAVYRPLAIPQITPSPAAPFLLAYPTALLIFGIPSESWHSFVDTVSAFLSAKVSQQAIHHAADIASSIGEFHKQYALRVKDNFRNIGKSAKSFSPGGVLSNTIGITLGSVGHVVTTVFQAAHSLRQVPKTPRERASAYVATANRDWFHSRGLHAVLMDTSELSTLCEVEMREMLSAASMCGSKSPESQLAALQDVIGEVRVEEAPQSSAIAKTSPTGPSKAAGKRPVVPQLQLGGTTLWLVLVQKQDDVPGETIEKH